jgi:hypothetical protein
MPIPNLFRYATSELSQDAFICWLLDWANPKNAEIDPELCACGQDFVQALLQKKEHKIKNINKVSILRQAYNIDVAALVNDQFFILIEDKKGTREHSNQLARYKNLLKAEEDKEDKEAGKLKQYAHNILVPIFFKLEEQGDYNEVDAEEFERFTREDMLAVFDRYLAKTVAKTKNSILVDFDRYVRQLNYEINAYSTIPFEDWEKSQLLKLGKHYPWQGLFTHFQNEIGKGGWGYVSNPSGGLWGFWWGFKSHKINNVDLFQSYLQLEGRRLIFKIEVFQNDSFSVDKPALRQKLWKKLSSMSPGLKKHGKSGRWMSLARMEQDYLILNKEGKIDLDATLKVLKKMNGVLKQFQKELLEMDFEGVISSKNEDNN